MSAKAVLLRGVNVGGAGKLPMAELRELLTNLGLQRVQSYIQSGNAVFHSDLAPEQLEPTIREAIADRFGFAPEAFVLSAAEITAALTDHPFTGVDPARVHVYVLRQTPAPDEAALQALALPGDGWHIGPRRFTLHTPAGFGTSKLAEKLPKHLSTPMTARNLRTLTALHALMADLAHP